jgi:MoaA/NifB/PqqE/SkfB family radical SAM enzyme
MARPPKTRRPAAFAAGMAHLGVRQTTAPLRYRAFGAGGALGAKPTNVNIEVIDRCCLRCQMCDIWKSEGKGELSIEGWIEVVRRLKDWLGTFRLTITGGEPLMKHGIWDLLEASVGWQIPTVLITSAYTLREVTARRLAEMGLVQVVVSVDDVDPEGHDAVRGRHGAHERAMRAIATIAETRSARTMLGTSTTLLAQNLPRSAALAHDLGARGVDRIFFQPVQGGFKDPDGTGWPYTSDLWPDPDVATAAVDGLVEAKRGGVPITNSFEELDYMKAYFIEGGDWVRPFACDVKFSTFHIDGYGMARMCLPYPGNIGNVSDQMPADIWNGAVAQAERSTVEACTAPCLLNCNRRYGTTEKLTYAKSLLMPRRRASDT